MYRVVLLRHGESTCNKENRFTGWTDVDLSEKGLAEAQAAGRLLREGGFDFDIAYTSVLKRALRTFRRTANVISESPDLESSLAIQAVLAASASRPSRRTSSSAASSSRPRSRKN